MPNDNMKNMVLGVLNRHEIINKIKIKVGLAYVNPRYYSRTREAIAQGDIEVKHKQNLSTSGKYYHKKNKLFIKFKSFPNELYKRASKEALILHECTHAALDIRGLTRSVLHSEACAYVAQYLYYYYRLPAEDFENGKAKPPFRHDVLGIDEAAWNLSKKMREDNDFYVSVPESLFFAIQNSKTYKKKWEMDIEYDGV